jgi:quercetin dioxygenase-like cupin family protein
VGLIAVLLMTAGLLQPSAAQEAPPPIGVEILTPRSTFTDDVDLKVKVKLSGQSTKVVNVEDPSRTVVARFTVQPGARFPWHTHPGPVVVNVVSGELVLVDSTDCLERVYPAGTAFVDLGHGHVHTAFNRSSGVTVLVATFFEVETDALIPAEPAC